MCDNYRTHKTPAVKTWLAAPPRFQMHFTPTYSSWLNQVGFVEEDLLSDAAITTPFSNWKQTSAVGSRTGTLTRSLHLDQ